MAVLYVALLGRLQLIHGSVRIEHFRTRKSALLLAYLSYYSHRQHSREELADLYWPELAMDAARHNLRQAVSTLRRYLEPDPAERGSLLRCNNTHIQLDPTRVQTDVDEFRALLDQGRREPEAHQRALLLERAVSLYAGDLLPGYYEEWVLAERRDLSLACTQALQRLWEHYRAEGDTRHALEKALQAARFDPYNEVAHHAVMTLFQASNQPERAITHYRSFAQRLQEELGSGPSAALSALADRIALDLAAFPISAIASGAQKNLVSDRDLLGSETPRSDVADAASRLNSGLPRSEASFFGRESEVQRILALLKAARLVTLTGLGGSGKTRLAVEIGRTLAAESGDSLCFVPLTDVVTAAEILPAILAALESALSGGERSFSSDTDPLRQLKDRVRRPTLLILDNFEHLVQEGSALIQTLLEGCENLTLLVTSRVPLALTSEHVYPVRPLEVPSATQTLPDLLCNPSFQLFVNRAQARCPDFRATPQNASAIAQLCAELDGLPLALELAAARIVTLTPAQIRRQLASGEGRFQLLVSRHRDRQQRHGSLQVALEWSCLQLPPAIQRLFARLSVLQGSWTAEAAGAIGGLTAREAMEALEELCLCSLITPLPPGADEYDAAAPQSFSMLETLREYGRQRLSAEETRLTAQRHADFFLDRAEQNRREEALDTNRWLARLRHDEANLIAALEWCFSPLGDEAVGMRLCIALVSYWRHRGLFKTAWRYLERALASERSAENELVKARLLQAASYFASMLSNPAALTLGRACVALRRTQGDPLALAQALHNLGHYSWLQADYVEAERNHREALALRQQEGDRAGMALSYNGLGSVAWERGDVATARQCWTQNLTLSHAGQDESGVAAALLNLCLLALEEESWDRALALSTEALAIYTRKEEAHATGLAHCMMARAAGGAGRHSISDTHFRASLSIMERTGSTMAVAGVLLQQACMARHRNDTEAARRLLRQSAESMLPFADLSVFTWIHEFGLLACSTGNLLYGVRLLACVERAASSRFRLHPSERKRQDACLAHARLLLSEADYVRAWEEGQALSWQEAIGLALTL